MQHAHFVTAGGKAHPQFAQAQKEYQPHGILNGQRVDRAASIQQHGRHRQAARRLRLRCIVERRRRQRQGQYADKQSAYAQRAQRHVYAVLKLDF